MRRLDIGDRLLAYLVFAAAVVLVTFFAFQHELPRDWHLPGSPTLYLFGVAGTILLCVSVVFVITKRTGIGGSPLGWFSAHVVTATLGAVLVTVHSGGFLRYAPALLLVALLFLVILGVWARVCLSKDMSATFASREQSFSPLSSEKREQMARLIEEKESLLSRLEPGANEGVFSPRIKHWLTRPGLTLAYARLVGRENKLLGMRASVSTAQAYWRLVHIVLAFAFILGMLGHIITVTFFAGYVSGGGEIYWWHLTKW
ncbi:MAG: hypothetical protein OXE44_15120 [Nitrospinae bacterium]|nr:hypothetical protein [Nitrospinota bacterium]